MSTALFICSTHFHLEMFNALSAVLRADVHPVAAIDERLRSTLGAQGERDTRTVTAHPFALSGLRRLLRHSDRMAAARALIADVRADLVLVGNDVAPIERAVVHAARGAGLPVLLLQDGLFPAWRGAGLRRWLAHLAMRVGTPDLAPTEYGCGEATHIGALGAAWATAIRGFGSSATVEVTGNVAYARILASAVDPNAAAWRTTLGLGRPRMLTFFTTDLMRGLGRPEPELHRAQLATIVAVANALRGTEWSLVVRLHPAESQEDYRDVAARVPLMPRNVPLAHVLAASDAGLVTGSAVGLLLRKLGRPTFWPAVDEPDALRRRAAEWLDVPIVPVGDLRVLLERPLPSGTRLDQLLADDDGSAVLVHRLLGLT